MCQGLPKISDAIVVLHLQLCLVAGTGIGSRQGLFSLSRTVDTGVSVAILDPTTESADLQSSIGPQHVGVQPSECPKLPDCPLPKTRGVL